MKVLLITLFSLVSTWILAQSPSIGGFNVYYGDLHNHSDASDGAGTPSSAYNYAKNTAKLDFFSLADHSAQHGDFTPANWFDIKNQANAYNENGKFVAFYGFEWSHDTYGHIAVINTDDYCSHLVSPTNTFQGLVTWLSSRNNGVAFFNHPGRQNQLSPHHEFNHFKSPPNPSRQLVGMELWNRGATYGVYYYNDGYDSTNGKGYFDEALSLGWRIGASGAGDEHGTRWGTRYPYRMAILANNLTRADLLVAMKARRFYSTLDKNLALSFKINGNEMGSIVGPGNNNFQIQAIDGDGEIFNQVVLLRNGQTVLTWNINTSNVNISINRNTFVGEYYYIKVRQSDGNEAISSPIWISNCPEILVALRTITSNETITGCDVILDYVTIQNNANVIINAQNSTTFESNFEIKAGSTLEIR